MYWTKNGQRLDIQGSGGKYSGGVSTDDPSLTVNNVNEHDAGDYQLTAINSVGLTKSDVILLGVPDIVLERPYRNEDGSQCFTVTISSLPAPFFVQWSMKDKKSGTLQQINVNAEEYKGTSNTFPSPVLVVKHNESLENYSFRIQVENVIGFTEKNIQAAAGASAAISDYDHLILTDLSHIVIEYIQLEMEVSPNPRLNWEELAHLHGWTFKEINTIKQKLQKRMIDSPFLELILNSKDF